MSKKAVVSVFVVCGIITLAVVYALAGGFSADKTKNSKGDNKIVATDQDEEVKLKDGEYTETADGYAGPVTVKVTIKNGKIAAVDVISQNETPEFYAKAKAILPKIVEQNSADVDVISGATVTSNAIKNAVRKALIKAGAKENSADKQASGSNEKNNTKKTSAGRLNPVAAALNANVANLKDGTYVGVGVGYKGTIEVAVKILKGRIVGIDVLRHKEDQPYFSMAYAVIRKILSGANRVDAVTNATYSSNGIIAAVNDALSKASLNVAGSNNNSVVSVVPKPPVVHEPQVPPTPDEESEFLKIKERTKKRLKELTITGKLKDGSYDGYGVGYLSSGTIKTTIEVSGGKLTDIKVSENKPDYADDIIPFRGIALNGLPFFKDNAGMENIAYMVLFSEYKKQITDADDMYKKAVELIGKKYAVPIKGLDKSTGGEKKISVISGAIKQYLKSEYSQGKMLDSVTGATVSYGGIANSVDDALKKAANDYITDSGIKELKVVAPKNSVDPATGKIVLKNNRKEPLDLSALVISMVKKDGEEVEVKYSEFKDNKLVIKDSETGKELVNGMDLSYYKNKGVILAEVKHIPSIRSVSLPIWLGNYSKNYIVGIEYSVDGNDWKTLANPKMDDIDGNNIAYNGQVIEIPKSWTGKIVNIRVVGVDGTKYDFSTVFKVGSTNTIKYNPKEDYNNGNIPPNLFINFKLTGSSQEEEQEIEVDNSKIGISGDHGVSIIERVKINPISVVGYDPSVILDKEIKNLPKGLTFDGKHITGVPEVDPSEFGNGFSKTYDIVITGRQGKVKMIRKHKLHVLRDRDRDQIADADEYGDDEDAFNPKFSQRILERKKNDPLPTLDDYMAMILNLPKDGSVTVKIANNPDMNEVKRHRVNLEFAVNGLTKIGKSFVFVDVKE